MGKGKRLGERSILRGALAGLAGGIAGSGAKMLAERVYPPVPGESTIFPLESGNLETTAKPWVLGAVVGAAYGAAMEIEPKAGVWGGAGFGLAIRKFSPETLSAEADANAHTMTVRQLTQQRQSRWISYAVFGVVTEAVRRLVRRGL
jgi:putative membrane protein